MIFSLLIVPFAWARFNDAGFPGWHALLLLVPLVGWFCLGQCLVVQNDYATEKRLDKAGRILFGSLLAAPVLLIALAAVLEG